MLFFLFLLLITLVIALVIIIIALSYHRCPALTLTPTTTTAAATNSWCRPLHPFVVLASLKSFWYAALCLVRLAIDNDGLFF